jgi:acyl carrier protein
MSATPFTFEDLKLMLAEHAGLDIAEIPDDRDAPVADFGLDSLGVVEIQLALHRLHGLPLSDDDDLGTVTLGELVEQVNQRAGASAA